ncbi:isochorismatase family protein [Amycolatopsis orientalis]|uniref:isochorismatase family protein n=1 Tax=Amycolatopsis orientalis TaxID=31958 RepID=UPI0022876EC5|nr:isochorismatase family protein [Amycolatopsis orientalis]
MQTNVCVEATARAALARNFEVAVPRDAVSTPADADMRDLGLLGTTGTGRAGKPTAASSSPRHLWTCRWLRVSTSPWEQFVAAIPEPPEEQRVFVGGDEIMVVFSHEKTRDIGFGDSALLR